MPDSQVSTGGGGWSSLTSCLDSASNIRARFSETAVAEVHRVQMVEYVGN